jgi:hypothetical protein
MGGLVVSAMVCSGQFTSFLDLNRLKPVFVVGQQSESRRLSMRWRIHKSLLPIIPPLAYEEARMAELLARGPRQIRQLLYVLLAKRLISAPVASLPWVIAESATSSNP